MDTSNPRMNSSEHQAWDRLQGEPDLWYGRFQVFLQLGPTRTLWAAFREAHKLPDGERGRETSAWRRNATRWHWRDRGDAWDAHQRDLMALSERNRRRALRDRRVAIMEDTLETIREVLDTADIANVTHVTQQEWIDIRWHKE